jgi:hypothetical protein
MEPATGHTVNGPNTSFSALSSFFSSAPAAPRRFALLLGVRGVVAERREEVVEEEAEDEEEAEEEEEEPGR